MSDRNKEFRLLYNSHWAELYSYAFNVVRNKSVAEDVVQDVFIDYWNRVETLNIELPRAYLFQAVRNQCAKSFKNKTLNQVQIEKIAILIPELDDHQYEEIKFRLLQEIDMTAVSILPEKCLRIFRMRFYDKQSYKDIALQLGITESTVQNQINKALKLLRGSTKYI